MAGLGRLFVSVMVLAVTTQSACAFGGCWYSPSIVYSYSWPIVPYAYYGPSAIRVIPLQGVCESVPPPPPGPQTSEPPLKKQSALKAPLIESTSSLGALDRCKVAFWNLTGHEVTLTIAGKTHSLPRNRTLILQVEREFRWHADNGSAHLERVPEGLATHDVVVRE